MANSPFTGSVTGSGRTPSCQPWGDFNISLLGTWTGTVYPERSFDNGTTWQRVSADIYGGVISWTTTGGWVATEPEAGVLWTLNYTISTGTLVYRLSQ